MMRHLSRTYLLSVVATMCCIVLHASETNADLVLFSNYEFNGDLSDSLGHGANLVSIGSGSVGGGFFAFEETDGLRLDSTVASQDYRIEMDVTFSSLEGFDKLIDFKSGTSDAGLYIDTGDKLTFYNSLGTGSSTLVAETPYTISIERNSETSLVTVRLGGGTEFSFNDGTGAAIDQSDELFFFLDDTVTTGEGSSGSVDAIRIYTSAVPEPNSIILFGLGFVLITTKRTRRRSAMRRTGD